MRYYQLIIEGYKEAQTQFAAVSDPDQVREIIQKYRLLVDKNQVQGNERNIDWWRKQGWDKFSKFVTAKSVQPSKKQIKTGKVTGAGDVIVLRDDAEWRIVIPLDKNASVREGRGSDWCTAKANQTEFEEYTQHSILIYCIKKDSNGNINFNSPMWAILERYQQGDMNFGYYNKQDSLISNNQFDKQTGLSSAEIIAAARSGMKQRLQNDENYQLEYLQLYRRSRSAAADADKQDQRGRLRNLLNLGIKPSEAVQLAAVKNYGTDIEHIIEADIKPSEAVQLAAVQANGYAIEHIIKAGIKPSEQVQLAAVKWDEKNIEHIIEAGIKPSEAVQLAAVQANGSAIRYIKEPSEAVQLAAVQAKSSAIYYISNPSEEVQLAAVNWHPSAIDFIKDPSEAVQLAAGLHPQTIKKDAVKKDKSIDFEKQFLELLKQYHPSSDLLK